MDESVQEIYGNRVRIRVCGICCTGDSILMVNHRGLRDGPFWSPPGGGMEFGVSASENLVREFAEETGLIVTSGPYLFATEFIKNPLHAVELFFSVTTIGGRLQTGHDPEMLRVDAIIQDVRFMTFEELDRMPAEAKHGAFGLVPTSGRIRELNGYFRI